MLTGMVLLFSVLLGLDLLFKQYVEDSIEAGREREIFGGKLTIRKVYNKGFLLNAMEQYPAIVSAVSIAGCIGILLRCACLFMKKRRYGEKVGMILISSGAASNTFDRLARGRVIDYIGFRTKWPLLARLTFNLGDFCIFLGAVMVSAAKIFGKKSK